MLSSACNHKTNNHTSDELTLLVGTYTSPNGSKGIYTYRFNENTGEVKYLNHVEVENPSYLTLSKDNRFVYSVGEMNDNTAAAHAFAFDKQTGSLKLINSKPTFGKAPCYIATDGKRVVTANYSGGNISVFPIRYDGSLDSVCALYNGDARGVDAQRQAQPHMHCAYFSPDSNYLFATDFSADRILKYAVSPNEEKLYPLSDTIEVAPGSGPRHIIFSNNSKYAYLISEISGRVTAFSYNDGKLSEIQTISSDTLNAQGSADIHMSPDGKYLYTSNRLKGDGIAIFEINQDNGTLAKVGYQLTGIHPRNFNITPNGKYLLVACRDSDIIEVFKRDSVNGLLEPTGNNIQLSKPVCIQFAQ